MSDLDDLILEITCPYCGAEPTYWCETKSGRPSIWLHSARGHLIREAYGRAYMEGYQDGQSFARLEVAR